MASQVSRKQLILLSMPILCQQADQRSNIMASQELNQKRKVLLAVFVPSLQVQRVVQMNSTC